MPGKARKQKAVHRSKVLIGLCDSCHSLALLNLLTWRCLLMTFIRDVIIGVSFKVSFPHLYLLEVWQSQMRLCYKRYTVLGILSLLQKITPEIVEKTLWVQRGYLKTQIITLKTTRITYKQHQSTKPLLQTNFISTVWFRSIEPQMI